MIFFSVSGIGELTPVISMQSGGRLQIWPSGMSGPCMTQSVDEWYALVDAVNTYLMGLPDENGS